MKLSDWVAREGAGAKTRLQKATGKTFATISRIVRGKCVPEWETATAISAATGGECSAEEILADAITAKAARRAVAS